MAIAVDFVRMVFIQAGVRKVPEIAPKMPVRFCSELVLEQNHDNDNPNEVRRLVEIGPIEGLDLGRPWVQTLGRESTNWLVGTISKTEILDALFWE